MRLKVEKTKHASRWKKCIADEFGENKGLSILNEVNELYEQLCIENNESPLELKEHTEKIIYPLIALYKVMLKYMDKKNAMKFTEECFFESVHMQEKTLKNFINSNNLASSFPGTFAEEMRKSYSEKAGFRIKFITVETRKARFDILECPYEKITADLDCSELCHCFCGADEMCYDGISPELKWHRRHTLADNDDYCDFSLEYIE